MTFAVVWLAAAAVVVAMFVMFVAAMPTVMLHVSLVFSRLVSWMQHAACDHWHQYELMFHTPNQMNQTNKKKTKKQCRINHVCVSVLNRIVDSIFVARGREMVAYNLTPT